MRQSVGTQRDAGRSVGRIGEHSQSVEKAERVQHGGSWRQCSPRLRWKGCDMRIHLRRTCVLVAIVVLTGRVLDRTTGQPLAHVHVSSGNVTATTDSAGRFTLRGLHPGRVDLLLESDDVPAQHESVTLGAGTTHREVRACSTTLDYNCSSPDAPSAPGGAS